MKRYSHILAPLGIFILSRFLIYVLVWLLGMYSFGVGAHLVRWDAENYVSIAEFGYQFNGVYLKEGALIAFFPLFPAMMAGFSYVLQVPIHIAGLILSFCFGTGSALLLYKLVSEWKNKEVGIMAVTLLSFYPYSIFLSAPYTESLFMFCTLLTIFLLQRHRYGITAIVVGFACITRLTGGVLGLTYVYNMYRDRVHKGKVFVYSALALVPLCLFLGFQYLKYGTVFAFTYAQAENWNQHTVFPWEGLWKFCYKMVVDPERVSMWIQDGVILALMLLTLLLSRKKVPDIVWLIGFGVILLTLSGDQIQGMGRYVMLCIPFYYYWAEVLATRKNAAMLFIAASTVWMTLSTVLFSIREIIF